MTAAVRALLADRWAVLAVLLAVAVLILYGPRLTRASQRHRLRAIARTAWPWHGGTIRQHSTDRPDAVHDPREEQP